MSGSASKKVEKRLAGIECNGCNKIFASLFRYDQHRRSDALRGTACSALPDENRTSLYAVSRPNMSTASLLRRPAHRTRGSTVNTTSEKTQKHSFPEHDILHILYILEYFSYFFFPTPGLTAAVCPGGWSEYSAFFSYFVFFCIWKWGGFIFCILICIFVAYW